MTTHSATAASTEIELIAPARLHAHPRNPRAPDCDVADLVALIGAHGQTQPAIVRTYADGASGYEVLIGWRRRRACELLGRDVRCVVQDLDDDQALALVLSDNPSHVAPDPFLESEAVAAFLARPGWTVRTVSEQLGKPLRWVAQRANLRTIDPEIRKLHGKEGSAYSEWSIAMLERLALLAPAAQKALADGHRLSHVRDEDDLERYLADELHLLSAAPWKLDDATLIPKAGPCTTCPKSSAAAPGLFEDALEPGDLSKATCRDAGCWRAKGGALALYRLQAARAENPKAVLVTGRDSSRADLPPALAKKEVHPYYELQEATKSDKRAIPAIVVSGKDAGKTRWVLPPGTSSSRGRSDGETGAAKAEDTRTHAEKLKASKEAIKRRRMAHFVDEVRAAVEEAKTPSVDVVMNLLAAYEAKGKFWGAMSKARKNAFLKAAESKGTWADVVWPRVQDAIADSIRRHSAQALDDEYSAASWLADVLKLEANLLEAAARAEIPDPKWWGAAAPAKKSKSSSSDVDKKKRASGEREEPEREDLPEPGPVAGVCRKCGCTDEEACEGGCTWIEPDLCSSCAPAPAAVKKTKGRKS